MADDRKYRQVGYRDAGRREAPRLPDPSLSRAASLVGTGRGVTRCTDCGTLLTGVTDLRGNCPGCGTPIHACKQCTHFDPGSRFECTQPIPARIPDKSARNDCPHFALRVVVERVTSSGAMRPEDARRAFENLFKKR